MKSEERAAPIPEKPDDRVGWQRRFSSLVSQELATEARPSPSIAGKSAGAQLRREFSERFPTQPLPEWVP